MYWFRIEQTLQPTEREPATGECAAVLLSSAELERKPALSGLESVLHHTPAARDVRVCKAELRRDCVSGTLLIPQAWKDGSALACGYLITNNRVVLVDDTGALLSHLRHIAKEKRWTDGSIGRFVYAFLEQLMAKDLHHLEEIEDRIEELEERVLAGELENFNAPMAELRKETLTWFRPPRDPAARGIAAAARILLAFAESVPVRDLHKAEPHHADTHDRDDRVSPAVTAGGLVRYELHGHAGAELEVRLPGHHRGERYSSGAQPMDMQEEKILVMQNE